MNLWLLILETQRIFDDTADKMTNIGRITSTSRSSLLLILIVMFITRLDNFNRAHRLQLLIVFFISEGLDLSIIIKMESSKSKITFITLK